MLRTRLGAMSAAAKETAVGSSNEMDTSRTGTADGAMKMGIEAEGGNEKPESSEAFEIALAAGLEAANERAQWWNPELQPQVEARQSSVAEGVHGAASAWVADECNRALGRELSPEEEGQHAELVQAAKIEKT